jgi:hypothetical protein
VGPVRLLLGQFERIVDLWVVNHRSIFCCQLPIFEGQGGVVEDFLDVVELISGMGDVAKCNESVEQDLEFSELMENPTLVEDHVVIILESPGLKSVAWNHAFHHHYSRGPQISLVVCLRPPFQAMLLIRSTNSLELLSFSFSMTGAVETHQLELFEIGGDQDIFWKKVSVSVAFETESADCVK